MSAPVAGGKTPNSKVNIVWAMFQGIAVVTPVTGVQQSKCSRAFAKNFVAGIWNFWRVLASTRSQLSTPLISATSVRLFTKTDLK